MKKSSIFSWRVYLLVIFALFLGAYNYSIAQKERLLVQGEQIVLALYPVDPRSLMQGDYMILNFAVEREIEAYLHQHNLPRQNGPPMVVASGDDGVYTFRRLHAGEKLATGEVLLQYKYEKNRLKIGGGSFFFEEGLARLYDYAQFATLRVDENGKAIVTGLLDAQKRPLHKKRWDALQQRLLDE